MTNEDSDIKIFGSSKEPTDSDNDVLQLVQSIDHHRRNGNVGRARKLGKDLADTAILEESEADMNDVTLSNDVITEIGVLLLFSVEAALNYFLPTTQLSAIAIDSLHHKLGTTKSDFYKNVIESPAYSFYYLSVRKGSADVSDDIGSAFAMLCKHEGDPVYIEKGKHIYNSALKEVYDDVTAAGFEE